MGTTASSRCALVALSGALAISGCTGYISPPNGQSPGTGSSTGSGGTMSAGGGGAGSPVGAGGASVTGAGGTGAPIACTSIAPGRAPLRRLTTYEYNNTVRDLLGDTTSPGSALPAQVDSKQNLFGNDADQQSPSPLLIEKYQTVAESTAARATASATALGKLHSCATNVTTANEEACARMIATSLAPRALRRTVASTEIDELVTLYRGVRALSGMTFASGVAAIIESLLQ